MDNIKKIVNPLISVKSCTEVMDSITFDDSDEMRLKDAMPAGNIVTLKTIPKRDYSNVISPFKNPN